MMRRKEREKDLKYTPNRLSNLILFINITFQINYKINCTSYDKKKEERELKCITKRLLNLMLFRNATFQINYKLGYISYDEKKKKDLKYTTKLQF